MKSYSLALLAIVACSRPHEPEAHQRDRVFQSYRPFSICRLAKATGWILEGTIVSVGSPIHLSIPDGTSETVVPLTLSIRAVIVGRNPGSTITVMIQPAALPPSNGQGTPLSGVFFLWPIVNGLTGVHPSGGAFFEVGNTLKNNGLYAEGISRDDFVSEMGATSMSVVCTDEIRPTIPQLDVATVVGEDAGVGQALDGG